MKIKKDYGLLVIRLFSYYVNKLFVNLILHCLAEMILEELEVYQLALEISKLAWKIYNRLPKDQQYSQGRQFLEAADSVGANIAEGYGRFHYKDSLKFYYNSRGSLNETKHWTTLLNQRDLILEESYIKMKSLIETEQLKTNNFINSIKSKL
jgi:four helix bundle protein